MYEQVHLMLKIQKVNKNFVLYLVLFNLLQNLLSKLFQETTGSRNN